MSISTETAVTQSRPAMALSKGMRKCSSARSATTKPAQASPFGRTPVLSATREVALTNTDVPIWQKWYSYEEAASVKNASCASG